MGDLILRLGRGSGSRDVQYGASSGPLTSCDCLPTAVSVRGLSPRSNMGAYAPERPADCGPPTRHLHRERYDTAVLHERLLLPRLAGSEEDRAYRQEQTFRRSAI